MNPRRCPVCDSVMDLVPILTPVSYTLCCLSPNMLGDEVVSCPNQGCRVHQKPLCLDGRVGCRYPELNPTPRSFPVPIVEKLSEDLGLSSPIKVETTKSMRALELVHVVAAATDEASLEIELLGCFLDKQADARYEVLAPMPARVACVSASGVLHRSTMRHTMARVKKCVDASKTATIASSHTASGAKRRRVTVLSDPERSGPLRRVGGLKRLFSERSMKFYRNACSEKYRVKVHRLSFGMNVNTPTPDYEQLVRCMIGGSSEVPQARQMDGKGKQAKGGLPQSSQASTKGMWTKGKSKGKKGKSRWVPRPT